jgi:predicted TIM-barrel fold metal-dependent hydrolase
MAGGARAQVTARMAVSREPRAVVRAPSLSEKEASVFEHDGTRYLVADAHIHYWDARQANQANKYGRGFINCFYDYHRNLSPPEYVWPLEKFEHYGEDATMHDLFEVGHVDVAILQPTYLTDFYLNGFNTVEQCAPLKEKHGDRFVLNGAFDPREGERGLERFEALVERYRFKGVKLYTAEWKGDSKGWKLDDPWSLRYLERCRDLGVKNIHVHKGPTIWPLSRDAFDVKDVDDAATAFPELNFIVDHVGLPRLEDFCWIGVQEPNVYGGLAVAMPFMHTRPRYFAQMMGELLYWLGEDRLLFGSDYAIWQPRWLVERFAAFEMPRDMVGEYADLTPAIKQKILGLNAARLYDLPVPADIAAPEPTRVGPQVTEKPAVAVR